MAPVPLMEELVEEVLLRIPPRDPASLVRAALVCKEWCRIIAGPGFRRRFRELHRTPPMLGFCYFVYDYTQGDFEDIARFATTTSFNPPRGIRRFCYALDSRHGRVLVHTANLDHGPFVIWDPITDEKQELPVLPLRDVKSWGAAVFCAAPGNCDHLDCQRGAFNVVVAGTNFVEMFVYIYSWEVNSWSQAAQAALKNTDKYFFNRQLFAPSAFAGNALYFSCRRNIKILKYDMGMREISLIDGPPICSNFQGSSVLMTTEDGSLGVAYVLNFKLHIWSREVVPNRDAKWTTSRVIELATLPLLSTLSCLPCAIKYANGDGIIFLCSSRNGLFSIDLKSRQVRKVLEDKEINDVIPFRSFYTPALGMASKGEVPNAGTSNT